MRYNKLFSLLLTFFLLIQVSCKKNFVDLSPTSDLTAENYYTTGDRLEKVLIGAYNIFQTEYYQYDIYMNTDGRSDNCYVNGDNATAEWPLENFTYNSTNGNITRDWAYLYNTIKATNVVLENIPKVVSDPAFTSDVKNHISGEAKFLRAFAYFQLVTLWGDCPLVLTSDNAGNYFPARNKTTDVYSQIVSDLKVADSTLKATPYNGEVGRVTKGAADALLAKVYAQMGDYTNCLTYCDAVMTGPYSLVPNYANLWGEANKNNSESIFEIQHLANSAGLWGSELFNYVSSDNWPKRNTPAQSLTDAFNAESDTVRLKASVVYQNVSIPFDFPVGAYNTTVTPLPFPNKLPGADGSYNRSENQTMIRLADIILLKAEALNQTGQTAQAIPLINSIRTRVKLAGTTATSKNDVATAILKERRLELAFEGHRWNDLLRTDANGTISIITLLNSLSGASGPLNYNLNADRHQLLFPIPLQDLQINKNLVQNPGY